MRMADVFPTKYLAAADLQERRHVLTIAQVVREAGIDKPIMYFQGAKKGLCVNKTNFKTMVIAYGDNTDGWIGQPSELIFTPPRSGRSPSAM